MFSFLYSEKFKDFLASYAGEKATAVKPAVYVLLFLSLGTFFTDFSGDSNQINSWLLVSVTSFLISVVYFVIAGAVIQKLQTKTSKRRALSISFLFFTTEMLRAIYVAISELELSIATEIDWNYRIIAGSLTGILFFGLFSIVNNDSANYKNKLTELKEKESKLRESSKITRDDLVSIRNDAIAVIRKEINNSLNSLLGKSEKSGQVVVSELMRVSDDVVRPISHSIFQTGIDSEIIQSETKTKLFSPRILELASLNPFFPKATSFFAAIQILGLAMFGVENKLLGFASMATYVAWIFSTLFLAEKFLKPVLHRFHIILRFAFISIVYVVLSMCPFVFNFVSETLRIPQNVNFEIYLALIALIMIWPITFYVAIKTARADVLRDISTATEKLSWSTARLGAQLWSEKQKFAHLIHKNVQGALIAAALKLKNVLDSEAESSQAVAEIKKLLEDSVNLAVDENSVKTTEEYLNYLNEIWSGVFSLTISMDSETKNKLSNDPIAQNSINDLLTEFATNSVKHGRSTLGKVDLALVAENILKITMQNNGLNLPDEMNHGLGSKMALEMCISINEKNLVPQGVEFTFTLPIK